jgi:hypothetical protein
MTDRTEQFLSQIAFEPNSGCWLWSGPTSEGRYGAFNFDRKHIRAHRYAYEVFKGPIGDKYVCHKCDVTWCVNPDHLFLGDQFDNMRDAQLKGRLGVKTGPRKAQLSVSDVRQIKRSIQDREKSRDLAKRYGVSEQLISDIKHKRAWAHVDNA